jgi:hypothetical protein
VKRKFLKYAIYSINLAQNSNGIAHDISVVCDVLPALVFAAQNPYLDAEPTTGSAKR